VRIHLRGKLLGKRRSLLKMKIPRKTLIKVRKCLWRVRRSH